MTNGALPPVCLSYPPRGYVTVAFVCAVNLLGQASVGAESRPSRSVTYPQQEEVSKALAALRATPDYSRYEAMCKLKIGKIGQPKDGLDREAREIILKRMQIPANERSDQLLTEASRRYLLAEWRVLWDARLQAVSLADPRELDAAWSYLSEAEKRVYSEAARVGLSFSSVVTEPSTMIPAGKYVFPSSAPAEFPERYAPLLRGLLVPPSPERSAREVIVFASRLPGMPHNAAPYGFTTDFRWRYVCMSPDESVINALAEFALSPEGRSEAASIAYHLTRVRPCPISTDEMLRLLMAAPPDQAAKVLRTPITMSADSYPLPVEAVLNPQVPPEIREAIARALAGERTLLISLFKTSQDRSLDPYRLAVLEQYTTRKVYRMPENVPWTDWVKDRQFPRAIREQVLEVLCLISLRADPSGKQAARSVAALVADRDNPELAKAAASRLAELRERAAVEEARRKATQSAPQEADPVTMRKAFAESVKQLESGINDPKTSQVQREVWQYTVAGIRRDVVAFELGLLWKDLRRYADEHGGSLPPSLSNLTTSADVNSIKVAYFPVRDRPPETMGRDIIIAVVTTPLTRPDGSLTLALMASGDVAWTREKLFPVIWQRSNAARQALGAPPVPTDSLGSLIAWVTATSQPAIPRCGP